MKHWHIFVGSPGGAIIADARFDNGFESVDKFMKLSSSMFPNAVTPARVAVTEEAMYHQVQYANDYGIYVEQGPIRIMWVDCDECQVNLLN